MHVNISKVAHCALWKQSFLRFMLWIFSALIFPQTYEKYHSILRLFKAVTKLSADMIIDWLLRKSLLLLRDSNNFQRVALQQPADLDCQFSWYQIPHSSNKWRIIRRTFVCLLLQWQRLLKQLQGSQQLLHKQLLLHERPAVDQFI